MTEHEQTAEEIRAEIEQTRERLGGTVEALGAHLNPSLLKQRVRNSVREATIGRARTMARNARDKAEEAGRGFIGTLRDNPIPAAMIAGGIGWLLFGKRRERMGSRFDGDSDRIGEWDYHDTAEGNAVGERVASTARHAGESVVSGARAAGEKVASGASRVAQSVADRARASTHRVEEGFEQNPMVLGAVAAAVGLAVGMTLPVTDPESRLMGSKRDELMDKARDAISETKDKVRSAAERAVPEVKETLKEVARDEGLAGSA